MTSLAAATLRSESGHRAAERRRREATAVSQSVAPPSHIHGASDRRLCGAAADNRTVSAALAAERDDRSGTAIMTCALARPAGCACCGVWRSIVPLALTPSDLTALLRTVPRGRRHPTPAAARRRDGRRLMLLC